MDKDDCLNKINKIASDYLEHLKDRISVQLPISEMREIRKLSEKGRTTDTQGQGLNSQQRKEFEESARPLMRWLSKNCHPHMRVIVDSAQAEMLEGYVNFITDDYILG